MCIASGRTIRELASPPERRGVFEAQGIMKRAGEQR